MTIFLSHLRRWVASSLALVALTVLAATPSVAQLRFAMGGMIGRWNVYDPPPPNTLTQNVTTGNGRICGLGTAPATAAVCVGNLYPFIGGQNVKPIRPSGAVVQAGLVPGGPVNMPMASEWTQNASGMIPSGVIAGVISIWTIYEGRNAIALPASGKGLDSGAGPGNSVFAPVVAGVAADPGHMTLSFPGGFDPGMTTTTGVFIPGPIPSMPALPVSINAAVYTAGPNQFGGTAAILTDTPNRLTIDLGAGTLYQRTNGHCQSAIPFGDCQVGFAYGTDRRATSVRRNVHTALGTVAPVLTQPGYWHGNPWTTGTITVRALVPGDGWNSFAMSGLDTNTVNGARHLVLVSPIMNYDRALGTLDPGVSTQIGQWDMLIQTPEPGAVMGLIAGLGLIGGLSWRSGRRS
jgi:hypothetical protein